MKECPIFPLPPSPVNTHTDDAGDAVYVHSMYKSVVNLSTTMQWKTDCTFSFNSYIVQINVKTIAIYT